MRNINNTLNYVLLFLFGAIYLLALDKILDTRDEIFYLADSLLLIEGMRPSFSHSPTGLSTWVGLIPIIIKYCINVLSKINNLNLIELFNLFDLVIYENYKNLLYIKVSLIFLNLISLFTFYKISQKENFKIFFSLFILFCLLPFIFPTTFSGKPLFLASVFFCIALIFNTKKQYTISIIFYSLCISERLEYLIFFSYFLSFRRPKEFVYLILIFAAITPWFTSALIQNIKVLVVFLFKVESFHNQFINNLNNFLLIILMVCSLTYKILIKYFEKYVLVILVIIVISLLIFNKIPARWLYPVFIFILFQISFSLKKIDINQIYINILSILLSLFCIFNVSQIISDKKIQQYQMKENGLIVFGVPLLIENMKFNIFIEKMSKITNTTNIKNINFFEDNKKSPISFGESGNLEKLQFRRYFYLYYFSEKQTLNKEKLLYGHSGLYLNQEEWCDILNKHPKVCIEYN